MRRSKTFLNVFICSVANVVFLLSLENDIVSAVEARLFPIGRADDAAKTFVPEDTVIHVSLLTDEDTAPAARSAALPAEDDRISVKVTVNSNVELDEKLEDNVIDAVRERIVRDTEELSGGEEENSRPDMVIQVNVNVDEEASDEIVRGSKKVEESVAAAEEEKAEDVRESKDVETNAEEIEEEVDTTAEE